MVQSGLVSNPEVSRTAWPPTWADLLDIRIGRDVADLNPGPGKTGERGSLPVFFLAALFANYLRSLHLRHEGGLWFQHLSHDGEGLVPRRATAFPFLENFVEDKFSVQFIHRWMGTALTLTFGLAWFP